MVFDRFVYHFPYEFCLPARIQNALALHCANWALVARIGALVARFEVFVARFEVGTRGQRPRGPNRFHLFNHFSYCVLL